MAHDSNKLIKMADKFERMAQAQTQVQETAPQKTDEQIIDEVVNLISTARQSLTRDAASVANFEKELQSLVQAKGNWAKLGPKEKLEAINKVFYQYGSLPQTYMNPGDFRPVDIRSRISDLLSQLTGKYRF